MIEARFSIFALSRTLLRSSNYLCTVISTGRCFQMLWPSQNIWTLTLQITTYIDSAKSCPWWSEEYLLHFSKAAVFNTAINLKRSRVSGLELSLFQLVILLILNNPTHYKLAWITPRLQKFCCLRYISMIYLIFS